MTKGRTYLDYNATAPLHPVAREAMSAALGVWGNPSSVHAEGRKARSIVETAREQIAHLVNARASEIVFTSSATEANAWVMAGPWTKILVSRIEHDSVLSNLGLDHGQHGREIIDLPAQASGTVDADQVIARVGQGCGDDRTLVSLQLANNETGVIQPVADVARRARDHGMAVHCDAVQALGRIPVDFAALGADFVSLSAHKIGGPKGIGALIVRDGTALPALIPGGQERRRRGGTENVAAIAGFGAAAHEVATEFAGMARVGQMRDRLERDLLAVAPGRVVVGCDAPRLPNTSCIAVPGQRAETLVIQLDLMGIAVSAGAACSSGKVGASHVLAAMGQAPEIARAAIRISLGHETGETDIDTFLAAMRDIVTPAVRGQTRTAGGGQDRRV